MLVGRTALVEEETARAGRHSQKSVHVLGEIETHRAEGRQRDVALKRIFHMAINNQLKQRTKCVFRLFGQTLL